MSGRSSSSLKRPLSPPKTQSAKKSPKSAQNASSVLDLRHALNSARKTFEASLRSPPPPPPPPPERATRSTATSPKVPSAAAVKSPKMSPKKSSSAPASPVKDILPSKPDILPSKRPKLDNAPSDLLLIKASPNKKMTLLNADSERKKKKSGGGSMNEVIKLHQDEGVIHLLHGLPSSRRKSNVLTATNVSAARRRTSTDSNPASTAGRKSFPSRTHSKAHHQQRACNPLTAPLGNVKPCTQEDLMSQKTLDLLKQLPTKEYVSLWSSPTRYVLNELPPSDRSSASPASDMSDTSSSSAARTKPWNLITKNYKDVLVRTYPTFAQIMLSPVTSGLRHTINVNLIEELVDLMDQCARDDECKAVLVTGIGGTFSLGVDLSVLAYDAVEKQRRSAEALAQAVKKLTQCILR